MAAGDTQITICVSEGCDRPAEKRKMCNRHYLRWWKSTPKEERPPPTVEERFWAKVKKTPRCWEWQGARRASGHGMFIAENGRAVSAHAFALELELGYPTPEGKEACHRCDNPPCVNPLHIYYGTRKENIADGWARGHFPVGSERSAARLTEDQVIELRERYAAGGDAKALAAEYGIKVTSLRHIVLGLKWKHVGGPITRRRPKRTGKAA
ncbi:HNH endonuclease [Actinoallomurus purpureus]|uniref:HNH endonuclease n=1 Tax=Actinoallomurus purpureus TaxID=478114 RepID=UPI0020934403|nr:HNH endonuclease [Actinoallomurus purpureus]MCO6011539.1 HNH endonuclease [Actinoallomurus purpureus]